MPSLSPATVVCLAVGLVVAINGLLVLGLARGSLQRQAELFRTAARTAQSPWKKEDEALSELHRRVAHLPPNSGDNPA